MNYQEAIEILNKTSPLKITVSGDIGSGKSTFSKHLAQILNIPRVCVGELMREEAARLGITLDALNAKMEQDPDIDKRMDNLQREKARKIDRGVFEGRTAWYFVENPTVKVFLSVNPKSAAERIWNDDNAMRDKYESIDELAVANEQRKKSEILRYQKYYQIDAYAPKNFDVVVDTTDKTIEQVFEDTVVEMAQKLI